MKKYLMLSTLSLLCLSAATCASAQVSPPTKVDTPTLQRSVVNVPLGVTLTADLRGACPQPGEARLLLTAESTDTAFTITEAQATGGVRVPVGTPLKIVLTCPESVGALALTLTRDTTLSFQGGTGSWDAWAGKIARPRLR